jgi:hypothetical protein
MKKLQMVSLVILAMAALAGCSKTEMATEVGPVTDQQALASQVLTADSVSAFTLSDEAAIDDGGMRPDEYESLLPATAGPAPRGLNGIMADTLIPLRWGRHITGVERNSQATIVGDSIANVLLTKTITGEFWVGYGTRTPDTTIVDTIVKKPFTNIVQRKVTFKRIAHHDDAFRNWIPVAVTMVLGKTQGGNPFSIVSMEIADTRLHRDSTFTDPLNDWFRLGFLHGNVPVVPVGDSITVRVTVASADSGAEIVHLRQGVDVEHREFRRARMQLVSSSGGPGAYTRVYERQFVARRPRWNGGGFNLIADVLSRGSIVDAAAPYANEFWGIPYIVVGPR